MAHHVGPSANPKQFVLCFDGTGNKFAGDESDSNVLKIFRVRTIPVFPSSPQSDATDTL